MANPAITIVKSDHLGVPEGTTVGLEIDLGLSIDQAARILGVYLEPKCVGNVTGLRTRASVSFDPEDVAPGVSDDEHFVIMEATQLIVTTGALQQNRGQFFNFSGMNLITTRNLALCGEASGTDNNGEILCRVYYEKYTPSTNELVQYIAMRR